MKERRHSLDWQNKDRWLRGLFIVLYLFIGYLACYLLLIVTIAQFIFNLIWQKPNNHLLNFSHSLGLYAYELISYITFNRDEKPFPFSPWPTSTTY